MGPAPSTLDFFVAKLLDREEGGVHRAVDVSGNRLLCRDKHLGDQASAVRLLAAHGREEDLRVAMEGLLTMQDQLGSPGFVELTDRNWRPRPHGRVRTLSHQLDAAAAMLVGATRLGLDEPRVRAVDLIHRCLNTAPAGELPARLAEDWKSVLIGGRSMNTATAAAGALAVAHTVEEPAVDAGLLGKLADRLTEPVGPAEGQQEPSGVSRCGLAARIALALSRASHALGEVSYRDAACALLDEAMDRFYDPVDGGFWDRPVSEVDGCVHAGPPVGGGQPPRPIKRTCDAGLMLFAALELAAAGAGTEVLAGRARAAVEAATDGRAGGVYLGIGYDWESPTEPTVSSFRQHWARHQHDELPAGEDTDHLDLQQKAAYTHARVAAAQALDVRDTIDGTAVEGLGPARARLTAAGPWPQVEPTREVEPERFGVPNVPHEREVTAIYHTVAALRELGGAAADRDGMLGWVRLAQNDDGGFGEFPGRISNVASTHHAVVALHIAGVRPDRPRACADFLLRCQRPDGSFGDVPGMAGDLSHTGLAVAALHALGVDPAEPVRVAGFARAALRPDGGCDDRPGRRPSVLALRRAVSVAWLLGEPVRDPGRRVSWLLSCRRPDGGFAHRPGGTATIVSTCHAVAALALLGHRPDAGPACRAWLTARSGGGEDPVSYSATSSLGEENFALLQSESVLGGSAEPDWLALLG
jgi:hypothetical protein